MEVGGDLFDVVPLEDDSKLLVMADVMGKGLRASLFAASLRTMVRRLVRVPAGPADWLTELNELMFEQLSAQDVFITVQMVHADLRQHQLRIVNAGHCPLLIADGRNAVLPVAPEGMPLGIEPHAAFVEERVRLAPFSSVLLYTDGVTEAQSLTGEMFGQTRLENWFHRTVANGCHALELKQSLAQELKTFQGTDFATDDQTFLILSDETPRCDCLQPEPNVRAPLSGLSIGRAQRDCLTAEPPRYRAA
jgi:sigma-B regulation protein RsbU (phosphoserine phosphatase)